MKNMANKIINVLIVDDEQIVERDSAISLTGTPWDFVSAGKPPTEKMPWK